MDADKMNPCNGAIYILQIADVEDLQTSIEKLKQDKNLTDVVVLSHTVDSEKMTAAGYLVSVFRSFGIHKNERETILNQEDQTVALQLCLAQINKENIGEFDVEASKVIHAKKVITEARATGKEAELETEFSELNEKYTKYKKMCNLVDLQDVLLRMETELKENEALQKKIMQTSFILVDNILKNSNLVQKKILNLLVRNKEVQHVAVEVPLDKSSDLRLQFTDTSVSFEDENSLWSNSSPRFTPKTPKTPARPKISVTEQYAEKIFQSYLQMLVNTRCEISLARIINVPDRELDHKAFTDIKRVANQKNMPMYQMIISHIMRIRLGGKSYAPDPNSPLFQHVKGLGELTDLVHKLQTVVEEDPSPKSSIKRVINMIKNCIVKHRDNTLRRESILTVAERLQEQAQMCLQQVLTGPSSPPKSNACGGSMVGMQAIKTIRHMLDRQTGNLTDATSIGYLSDMVSSQRTPLRFPSVLSQFRSPIELSPDDKECLPLAERLKDKVKKPTKAAPARYQSYMDWVTPAQSMGFQRDQVERIQITDFTNSKTIVHAAPKAKSSLTANKVLESINDQENVENPVTKSQKIKSLPLQPQNKKNATSKRKANDLEDTAPQKKKKVPTGSKGKKKIAAIPNGQRQLTAFFRL